MSGNRREEPGNVPLPREVEAPTSGREMRTQTMGIRHISICMRLVIETAPRMEHLESTLPLCRSPFPWQVAGVQEAPGDFHSPQRCLTNSLDELRLREGRHVHGLTFPIAADIETTAST